MRLSCRHGFGARNPEAILLPSEESRRNPRPQQQGNPLSGKLMGSGDFVDRVAAPGARAPMQSRIPRKLRKSAQKPGRWRSRSRPNSPEHGRFPARGLPAAIRVVKRFRAGLAGDRRTARRAARPRDQLSFV